MILLPQLALLIIEVTRIAASVSNKPASTADPFWITVELRSVDFIPDCLKAAGCAEPRFKILVSNLVSNERQSISWAQQANYQKEPSRAFVSAWTTGNTMDIAVGCQVAGTDPLYGFPRTCDQSANVKAFDATVSRLTTVTSGGGGDDGDERRLVEIVGKCFNATLTVKSDEDRCPWCLDQKHVFIEDRDPESRTAITGLLTDPLQLAIVLLASCAILTTSAFAWLLVLYLRQQRRRRKQQRDNRIGGQKGNGTRPVKTYEARPVNHQQHLNHEHLLRMDEAKYDIPWTEPTYRTVPESHYRTLPYYATNGCNMPLIRATRIGHIEQATSNGILPVTKDSPNSSMGDSGVDSSGYSGGRRLW